MATGVRVRGVREFNKALKDVGDDLPKEMRKKFKGIAQDVVKKIRPKVARKTGKAARSVTARATQRGASIAAGGNTAPYYPWLDFGGRVGRHRSIEREIIPGGRYIYPTIAEEKDHIRREVGEAIDDVSRRAGLRTRGGIF